VSRAWAIVKFSETIEIGGIEMPAAKYTRDNFEEIFLIPAKGVPIPSRGEPGLVILPSFYHNRKTVYSVKIIGSKRVGEIEVFNNTFIPDDLFGSINGDKIAIIIMDPKEGFKTLLLRITVNNGNEKATKRFLAKNIPLEYTEVRIKKSGIIEMIIEPIEDFNYLRTIFIKHLSNQIYLEA